jgi:hypothetical protein
MAEKEKTSTELENEGLQALNGLDEPEDDRPDVDDPEIERILATAEGRGKIAQILTRGIINDKLDVKLKNSERVPYWIRERSEDIERMKALGGRFVSSDEVEGGVASLHGTETGRIRVGDVVLMSLPRTVTDVIADLRKKDKMSLLKRSRKEFLKQSSNLIEHYEERS